MAFWFVCVKHKKIYSKTKSIKKGKQTKKSINELSKPKYYNYYSVLWNTTKKNTSLHTFYRIHISAGTNPTILGIEVNAKAKKKRYIKFNHIFFCTFSIGSNGYRGVASHGCELSPGGKKNTVHPNNVSWRDIGQQNRWKGSRLGFVVFSGV